MKSMDQFDPLVTPTSPAKEKPQPKSDPKKDTPWPFPTGKPPRAGIRVGKDGKWEFVPPSGWVEEDPSQSEQIPSYKKMIEGYWNNDLLEEKIRIAKEHFENQYLTNFYQQQYLDKSTFHVGDTVCWKKEPRQPLEVIGVGSTGTVVVRDEKSPLRFYATELEFYPVKGVKEETWNEGAPPVSGWYETRRTKNFTKECCGFEDVREMYWTGRYWTDNEKSKKVYSDAHMRLWRALDGSPNTP